MQSVVTSSHRTGLGQDRAVPAPYPKTPPSNCKVTRCSATAPPCTGRSTATQAAGQRSWCTAVLAPRPAAMHAAARPGRLPDRGDPPAQLRRTARRRPPSRRPISRATPPAALVADMERVREHLGIDRWLVFGGSWGSTLGLAYAETHPERVTASRAAGGGHDRRRREVEWITRGVGRLLPEDWERFRDGGSGGRPRRQTWSARTPGCSPSPDADVREQAARDWCAWEDAHRVARPGAAAPNPRLRGPGASGMEFRPAGHPLLGERRLPPRRAAGARRRPPRRHPRRAAHRAPGRERAAGPRLAAAPGLARFSPGASWWSSRARAATAPARATPLDEAFARFASHM